MRRARRVSRLPNRGAGRPQQRRAAAADMVQNRFRNFEPDGEPLQSRGDGTTQIVDAPRNGGRGPCPGRRGDLDGKP
jgi:hypothetical protein